MTVHCTQCAVTILLFCGLVAEQSWVPLVAPEQKASDRRLASTQLNIIFILCLPSSSFSLTALSLCKLISLKLVTSISRKCGTFFFLGPVKVKQMCHPMNGWKIFGPIFGPIWQPELWEPIQYNGKKRIGQRLVGHHPGVCASVFDLLRWLDQFSSNVPCVKHLELKWTVIVPFWQWWWWFDFCDMMLQAVRALSFCGKHETKFTANRSSSCFSTFCKHCFASNNQRWMHAYAYIQSKR